MSRSRALRLTVIALAIALGVVVVPWATPANPDGVAPVGVAPPVARPRANPEVPTPTPTVTAPTAAASDPSFHVVSIERRRSFRDRLPDYAAVTRRYNERSVQPRADGPSPDQLHYQEFVEQAAFGPMYCARLSRAALTDARMELWRRGTPIPAPDLEVWLDVIAHAELLEWPPGDFAAQREELLAELDVPDDIADGLRIDTACLPNGDAARRSTVKQTGIDYDAWQPRWLWKRQPEVRFQQSAPQEQTR